jgi:hypothetical protein
VSDEFFQADFPPAPVLVPMTRIACDVEGLVSLGDAPLGERRYVPLRGGTVEGPEIRGRILAGGVDWQVARRDGALEIAAHYVIETLDGARVEVQSTGLRHGPAEVMARLAAGEPVDPSEYFFRTLVRFTTGHAGWLHLNKVMAIARGQRKARQVLLDLYRLS